jgi:hypothetical protein
MQIELCIFYDLFAENLFFSSFSEWIRWPQDTGFFYFTYIDTCIDTDKSLVTCCCIPMMRMLTWMAWTYSYVTFHIMEFSKPWKKRKQHCCDPIYMVDLRASIYFFWFANPQWRASEQDWRRLYWQFDLRRSCFR